MLLFFFLQSLEDFGFSVTQLTVLLWNEALSYSQFSFSYLQIHPSRMSFILVIVNSPLSLVVTLVSIPVGCRTPVSPALNVVILPYRVL